MAENHTRGALLPRLVDRTNRYAARFRSSMAIIAHSGSTRRALLVRGIVAAACGLFALSVGRSFSEASTLRAAWGPEVSVLVARADIDPGEAVDESAVSRERRPASLVPPDAVLELPEGATTGSSVLEGEVLVAGRLSHGGGGTAPAGTTAITLELAVAAPGLAPGDRIDILGPDDEYGTESLQPGIGGHRRSDDHIPLPEGSDVPQEPDTFPEHSTGAAPIIDGEPSWRNQVEVISRDAVVLRAPTSEDPTVEVAVADSGIEAVAGAALDGRVVVVRRSPG